MKSVTRVAQEAVMNSRFSLKELAERIGKPYPTLLRELNPYDRGAKLGVETLLEIMQATGDTSPLEYMARELGYDIAPAAIKTGAGKGNGCLREKRSALPTGAGGPPA